MSDISTSGLPETGSSFLESRGWSIESDACITAIFLLPVWPEVPLVTVTGVVSLQTCCNRMWTALNQSGRLPDVEY